MQHIYQYIISVLDRCCICQVLFGQHTVLKNKTKKQSNGDVDIKAKNSFLLRTAQTVHRVDD